MICRMQVVSNRARAWRILLICAPAIAIAIAAYLILSPHRNANAVSPSDAEAIASRGSLASDATAHASTAAPLPASAPEPTFAQFNAFAEKFKAASVTRRLKTWEAVAGVESKRGIDFDLIRTDLRRTDSLAHPIVGVLIAEIALMRDGEPDNMAGIEVTEFEFAPVGTHWEIVRILMRRGDQDRMSERGWRDSVDEKAADDANR